LAWQSIETNQFGTNEFIDFCKAIDIEPMLGVNMGTGTIQAAADLVQYCNIPTGTYHGDLRASHGYQAPHNVKYWCVGNEMDGPWQMGWTARGRWVISRPPPTGTRRLKPRS